MKSALSWIGAMQRSLLGLLTLQLMVAAADSKPPRLNGCREVNKAKEMGEVYLTSSSYSCLNITFPCNVKTYAPDTRNCENYYVCDVMTLSQCPCPLGQTFNLQTLSCDASNSTCDCSLPPTTTQATTLSVAPTSAARTSSATPPHASQDSATLSTSTSSPPAILEAKVTSGTTSPGNGLSQGGLHNPTLSTNGDQDETSVIIAAIVSGCVVVITVVVVFVFLYQKGRLKIRKHPKSSQPPGVSYVHTAPSERHVYAEIDEAMVDTQGTWRHQLSLQNSRPPPPPLPTIPPPPSRSLYPVTSATASIKRAFPHTNPHMRYERPLDRTQPSQTRWEDNCLAADSASDCSQCSACSSTPTSVDTNDSDMHAPLNSRSSKMKSPYVSKQVYI